jgi:hypothetical protein
MAVANGLFYSSNDPEKQTLHRRITPTDRQYDEQKERWNALRDHLVTDLKSRSGYSISTWLQGSYKFETQIRPVSIDEEFDIDLGVYYRWDGKPEIGIHSPKTLKSFVQDSLQAYCQDVGEVEEIAAPKPRCCRVRFANNFHIDVPAYHLDPTHDNRSLATEANVWEISDPKAIYLWFRDQFEDHIRAKVRRQTRYLKAWAALKFSITSGRPSSILLTVLVADAASELNVENWVTEDEVLCEVVGSILDRLEKDRTVKNPVNERENLARLEPHEMDEFIEQLRELKETAGRAISASDEVSAADIWQEAFEHLFPMPEVSDALTEVAKTAVPALIATPEIMVTAVPRDNTMLRYKGTNSIGPIPKNCDITFQITNASALPRDVQVQWTVRNEGTEAENVNDLGHRGETGLSATEYSAYRGTHYMDCVVRLRGQTIAIRRVPVIISGQGIAVRNRPKPFYTKLPKRR